jgi:hypothetical protein
LIGDTSEVDNSHTFQKILPYRKAGEGRYIPTQPYLGISFSGRFPVIIPTVPIKIIDPSITKVTRERY